MKKISFLFILIISFALFSCEDTNDPTTPLTQPAPIEVITPINYGNGVYYFGCTGKYFAASLSYFLTDSTKTLLSMAGNGTGAVGYEGGRDIGYFVVVKE